MEYPNQILYNPNGATGNCIGTLMFDTSEVLVYADRYLGQFGEGADVHSFARTFTETMNRLLTPLGPMPHGETARGATVYLESQVSAGPAGSQKTLFFVVQGHTLRMELDDLSEHQYSTLLLIEEIGDMRKWDRRSVPLKK
jgi:hypothetical protein